MTNIQTNLVQATLEQLNSLEGKIPQTIHGFTELSKAALKDGKFDKRTKEIMALAISIALYSKGCMKFHLQSLSSQDLDYDELMEIISVVTYLCGGSGLMSGTKALEYFNQMQQDSSSQEGKKSDG